MADLTVEQYGELPEFLKEDYKEVDGVYKHAGMMKVKQTANELDGKLKASELEKREADEAKASEIAAAREEALEEARSKNNTDEILRLEREKLEDAEKRLATEREELDTIRGSLAGDKQKTIIDRLSLKATDDGRPAFKRLVKDYILVDSVTRQETFLNEDGSASSLNEDSFFTEVLSKSPVFKMLLKAAVVTTGGGEANGSSDGSASRKAPKDMTGQERMEFKQRDPSGFKLAFNL